MASTERYDFVFAGGGAAGLSLACALKFNPKYQNSKILILDPAPKTKNDRTWCYWSTQPAWYDALAYRVWDQVDFIHPENRLRYALSPYRYFMIRGLDFYNETRRILGSAGGVEIRREKVLSIEDTDEQATVQTSAGRYTADWAFDSRYLPAPASHIPDHYHHLMQHFKGWWIETPEERFDPATPILFDFRVPQEGEMRFFYLLPFSRREALVEFTIFSDKLMPHDGYAQFIRNYIRDTLGIQHFSRLETESGIIPMTDSPFNRQQGRRTLAIGTRGGRVKPSSGYAFTRIQRDSAAIVASLSSTGHPFHLPRPSWLYAMNDTTMLQVMFRQGDLMRPTFTALFEKNSIQRIFRFLDEDAGLSEILQIMASVPLTPFLRAWFKAVLFNQI